MPAACLMALMKHLTKVNLRKSLFWLKAPGDTVYHGIEGRVSGTGGGCS